MKSTELKNEAMAWLRFSKRLPIVTTEVGRWNADVLGISKTMAVEVEVKVSKSDLRAEFENKVLKHTIYEQGRERAFVPNYFYFFIPEELKDFALPFLTEKAPKVGIGVYTPSDRLLPGHRISIIKRPQKLIETAPSAKFIDIAINRMSSELCGLHIAYQSLNKRVFETLESARDEVIDITNKLVEQEPDTTSHEDTAI